MTVKRAVDYRRLVQQNAMYRQDLEQMVSARTGMLNQAIADLERSYDITLEALGDALDLKDAETEGHSNNGVTAFTIALARGGRHPSRIRSPWSRVGLFCTISGRWPFLTPFC